MMQGIRWTVLLPTLILTGLIVVFGLGDSDWFESILRTINAWILNRFGWLFAITAFVMVILCLILLMSPIAKLRIGGEGAVPLLDRKRLFAITLCTTIASGILFWGAAEPMFHIQTQAQSRTATPMTYALSTMYLHWSFIPYAIYSIPTLLIALAIHNYNRSSTVASLFFPLGSFFRKESTATFIDTLCLFCLVAGMAASLGTVLLAILGGLATFIDLSVGWLSLFSLGTFMVLVFVISSVSGLQKGIKYLSTINTIGFIVIILLILVLGYGTKLIPISQYAVIDYVQTFIQSALLTISDPDDPWSYDWTVFYWAVWMAWAPISAIFLGQICKGYTVRMVLVFNWILPSLFTVVWMSILSGTSLMANQENDGVLRRSLVDNGPESVLFKLIDLLPFSTFLSVFFIVLMFLSFITSADSNTTAMASVSTKKGTHPSTGLKIFWGSMIGIVACVMVSLAGVEGIKMISNLGGLPALFFMILACVSVIKLLIVGYEKGEE